MSVIKNISSFPDTKRGFTPNVNNLTIIGGVFICEKDFTLPIADISDIESWYTALQNDEFTPLHGVKEFESLDKENILTESKQDFTIETYKGQYRNKLKYDWDVDYHELVQELSGTDKYVIYWDLNWNIYATSDDGINLRGFKTNRLILEKLMFSIGSTPALSVLDIELSDTDELNLRPVIETVSFNPEDIDRMFVTIRVEYVDSDTINFSVAHDGDDIDDIVASDVTVTDDRNGELTFTQYNNLGGTYQLSGFSANVITGKLEVLASIYIGCVRYSIAAVVEVINNFTYEDGENFVFEDGNNFVYETEI